MRKWIFVGMVVLAIAASGAVAVGNLDSYLNRNKDWLAERVETALGRRVEFSRLGVSLAGGLGVRVDDVAIGDDPAYSDAALLRADSALVRMRLLPALLGRYEIARVVLEQPVLQVVRSEAGLNLATLGRAQPSRDGDEARAAALLIATLDIENGSLRYYDRTATPPTQWSAESIDFSASDIRADAPTSFSLTAAALGAARQNVRAKGVIGPLPRGEGGGLPIDVVLEVEDLSTDNLARVPEIVARLPPDLAASGPVRLSANIAGVWPTTDIEISLVADRARVGYGRLLDKPSDVRLRVEAHARRHGETLSLESARLLLGDAEIRSKGTIGIAAEGGYDLAFTSDSIALAGWDEIVPVLAGRTLEGGLTLNIRARREAGAHAAALYGAIGLRDVAVRSRSFPAIAALTADVVLEGQSARMESVTFSLGGLPARASASSGNLYAPEAAFSLSCDSLPVAAPGARPSETTAPDVLRTVNVDGTIGGSQAGAGVRARITSSTGTLRGIPFRNLAADLRLDGDRVILEPLTLAAFGGTLRSTGVYDRSEPERPSFDLDTKAQGIRLGEAITAFGSGPVRLIDGTLDAELSLAGSGSDWKTISPALAGEGRIGVRDGVLQDVNLVDGILEGLTGVAGLSSVLAPDLRQKYPRLFATGDTLFDALEGRFRIAEGKLVTDDLLIRAADFTVDGRAGLGFDRALDVQAVLALSERLSADLTAHADAVSHLSDEQGRVRIPFRLAGQLPAARPQPDLDFVSHAIQRAAVEGFVDDIIDREKKRGPVVAPAASEDKGAANAPAPPGDAASAPAAKSKSEDLRDFYAPWGR